MEACSSFIRNDAVDCAELLRVAPLKKNVLKPEPVRRDDGGPIFRDKTFFFGATRAAVECGDSSLAMC